MPQGSRPDRVAEQIRQEISQLLLSDVHDPGIGLVTLTRVKVSPDLQLVRVFYTQMGDEKARAATRRALERATPFLRRQLGSRIRLRRVPELRFEFDSSVENQERIERILLDLQAERELRENEAGAADVDAPGTNTGKPEDDS
ncbi:MAG TPA: 30S ribosome-binding factor RbfA [Vicinamibacterales bacterium]|nr:30S ribosome-binding factor RbfA [Vicinamibacterales bacterium]